MAYHARNVKGCYLKPVQVFYYLNKDAKYMAIKTNVNGYRSKHHDRIHQPILASHSLVYRPVPDMGIPGRLKTSD
jgi:hypothetical protein